MPLLFEGLEEYWHAFTVLSNCRTYHMGGSNPISFSEINAYFAAFHIAFADREDFVYFIKKIDEEYMALEAKKGSDKGEKQ